MRLVALSGSQKPVSQSVRSIILLVVGSTMMLIGCGEEPLTSTVNPPGMGSSGEGTTQSAENDAIVDPADVLDIRDERSESPDPEQFADGKLPPLERTTVNVIVERPGDGRQVRVGDTVRLGYVLKTGSGRTIEASIRSDVEPLVLTLGAHEVVPGLEVGANGMRVGEYRRVLIPYEYAHVDHEMPHPELVPTQPIIYEIELLEILDGSETSAPTDPGTKASDLESTNGSSVESTDDQTDGSAGS